jgi:hypothetical protein
MIARKAPPESGGTADFCTVQYGWRGVKKMAGSSANQTRGIQKIGT